MSDNGVMRILLHDTGNANRMLCSSHVRSPYDLPVPNSTNISTTSTPYSTILHHALEH